MKLFCAISILASALVLCGCNADKSGETQAPIPASQQTKAPAGLDTPNSNVPTDAKKKMNLSIPPMPKGN